MGGDSYRGVLIIGAGGHGREVADILRQQAQATGAAPPTAFIDDNPELSGKEVDGLPVHTWDFLNSATPSRFAVICASGSPAVQKRLTRRAMDLRLPFAQAVSPSALISSFAVLGQGVTVFPNVVVNTRARIEDFAILNIGVSISHDSVVGRYCNINPGARLAGNVRVGEGCYIGMGSTVIQGLTIGPWTVVGAGATVINDLPANVTAVGIPAKVKKTRQEDWHEAVSQ